jgi:hypothetical protein
MGPRFDSGFGDEEGVASTRGSIFGRIVSSICGSSVSSVFWMASWKSDALVLGGDKRGLGLSADTDSVVAFSVGDDTRKDAGARSARFGDDSGVELVVTAYSS